jgi:N,N'-diacetyllegionaminate synthase
MDSMVKNKSIIEINKKKIGLNNSTYFIAEAGLNHNGDIKIAKKLIDEAKKSGADAVKFQTYNSEEFLTTSSQYFEFFKNVELSYEDFGELSDYAKNVGITFFSSPFDIDSATELKKIGVPCFKIASSDLTNLPLIKHISKMNLPMIISTGVSTMEEIEEAVNLCYSENNNKIALMHCVADYPTKLEESNLRAIESMKQSFNVPIGYSDNGESDLVDIVAVSLGANLIERHFTLDKNMKGPDHSFSITPIQLTNLISQIRLIEKIRGNGIKTPTLSELKNKNEIRKSITTKTEITQEENFSTKNITIKRPATGIEPKFFEEVLRKKATKKIQTDCSLQWSDVS